MSTGVKVYADSDAVAEAFANDFLKLVQNSNSDKLTVALSGGSTPKILFQRWAREFVDQIDWSRVHFFWGDERCVAPDDDDSNYGVAKELFLDKVDIPSCNVHRVLGESTPERERARYEREIMEHVELGDRGLPRFDLVILGMGDDGHTASIFPHESEFLTSKRVCEVATHPLSGQKRITLTGPVLNAASKVAFLVTGKSKADVLAQVINKVGDFKQYPASHVSADDVAFYVDAAAVDA